MIYDQTKDKDDRFTRFWKGLGDNPFEMCCHAKVDTERLRTAVCETYSLLRQMTEMIDEVEAEQ